MAKGAIAKEEVAQKILAAFPEAFKYDKEIRVPVIENGEPGQIKITMTWAKSTVEQGGDVAVPGDFPTPVRAEVTPTSTEPVAPTADEKAAVANLLKKLGL